MMLRVIKATHLKRYTLELTFNNSMVRTVDLEHELEGEIFEPLKDEVYFKNFQIKTNTLEWDNGADFAPEYLFLISHPKEDSLPLNPQESACYTSVQQLYRIR